MYLGARRALLRTPATAAAPAFTPASLTGLVWWAEADNADNKLVIAGTGSAPTDGQEVGYLADKSGVGNHFLALADNTTRPTFRSTAGGSPSVQFDGSNDMLARATNMGLYDAIGSAVFIAVRGNSPAANSVLFSEGGGLIPGAGGTTALFHYMRRHGSTADMSDVFVRNDPSSSQLATNLVTAANAFAGDKVIGIIDTGALVTVYVDGVSIDNNSYTRSGVTTIINATLGASRAVNDTNNSFFAGYLHAGLAMTDVPTAQEIANITTYLGAKQGRTI